MKNAVIAASVSMWVLTAGCDAPDSTEADFRDDYTCPTWRCGFNSAEVNGRSIRELNLDGAANGDGMRIVSFAAPLGLLGNFQLAVEGDELVARSGSTTLRGAALIGATLVVKGPGLLSLPVTLTIAGYSEIDSWAAGAPKVATYALLYPDPLALVGVKNVCTGDLTDALATAVTVLGGETYDLATKTVHADQSRWFTLACAGSAAAKLRLMNYGPHSERVLA